MMRVANLWKELNWYAYTCTMSGVDSSSRFPFRLPTRIDTKSQTLLITLRRRRITKKCEFGVSGVLQMAGATAVRLWHQNESSSWRGAGAVISTAVQRCPRQTDAPW